MSARVAHQKQKKKNTSMRTQRGHRAQYERHTTAHVATKAAPGLHRGRRQVATNIRARNSPQFSARPRSTRCRGCRSAPPRAKTGCVSQSLPVRCVVRGTEAKLGRTGGGRLRQRRPTSRRRGRSRNVTPVLGGTLHRQNGSCCSKLRGVCLATACGVRRTSAGPLVAAADGQTVFVVQKRTPSRTFHGGVLRGRADLLHPG